MEPAPLITIGSLAVLGFIIIAVNIRPSETKEPGPYPVNYPPEHRNSKEEGWVGGKRSRKKYNKRV